MRTRSGSVAGEYQLASNADCRAVRCAQHWDILVATDAQNVVHQKRRPRGGVASSRRGIDRGECLAAAAIRRKHVRGSQLRAASLLTLPFYGSRDPRTNPCRSRDVLQILRRKNHPFPLPQKNAALQVEGGSENLAGGASCRREVATEAVWTRIGGEMAPTPESSVTGCVDRTRKWTILPTPPFWVGNWPSATLVTVSTLIEFVQIEIHQSRGFWGGGLDSGGSEGPIFFQKLTMTDADGAATPWWYHIGALVPAVVVVTSVLSQRHTPNSTRPPTMPVTSLACD
ncbi:hypothetical protein T484DRAFT_1745547 [Baffinella frigidus]|nr:hypothetical protein T484DRAFT_1745547 [Cryptophyta sp. CCMP2293]